MQSFADETGGTAFVPKFSPRHQGHIANDSNARKNEATLTQIFKQLENELRAQYLVQYNRKPNIRMINLCGSDSA